MKKTLLLTAGLSVSVLSGCATQSIQSTAAFRSADLNAKVQSGELVQTKNTFFVIDDASSSMSEIYEGNGFGAISKHSVSKTLLSRFNQTIPNITLKSGLRSYGNGPCLDWSYTKLNQPVQNYSTAGFDSAIASLSCSSGGTPISTAFAAAPADLSSSTGNIATILFSDGHNYDKSPINEIIALKDQYGDKFCLYTVWVGNAKEEAGQVVLEQLANATSCGFSTTVGQISSTQGMADFVSKVFFTPGTPQEGDEDGDGVVDSKDKCPNTPKGAIVDRDGCWAFHGVLFDFDKADIKPGYENLFNNAVKVMKSNPTLTVEIQGHTDSKGSDKYNLKLSQRRAESVKQYMISRGVEGSRMTTKGFGESKPIATNETEFGRMHNRRVTYKRTDLK